MRIMAVGGTFDDMSGRKSGYVAKLFDKLKTAFDKRRIGLESGSLMFTSLNGGTFEQLERIIHEAMEFRVFLWFADVDNAKEKLIDRIKQENPECLLVSSKRNIEGKYSVHDLVARALHTKANLTVEFTSSEPCRFEATILDPLGNSFLHREVDIDKVADALASRIERLLHFTRTGSYCIGTPVTVPDEKEFFSIVRNYAETFHNLIHAANQSRLLGNCSFRCERGFPGFRAGGLLFVSKRNIDKRDIGPDGFVPVSLDHLPEIRYLGRVEMVKDESNRERRVELDKPSVDAPVQANLARIFPRVKYFLHSHVYIEGASMTQKVIPCGALEEVGEIASMFADVDGFCVNLRGHGSLIATASLDGLRDIPYVARPAPEPQEW